MLKNLDDRGLFTAALIFLTISVFVMMAAFPSLRANDLFKELAQGIVMTGLINLAGAYLYGASKPSPVDPNAASTATVTTTIAPQPQEPTT